MVVKSSIDIRTLLSLHWMNRICLHWRNILHLIDKTNLWELSWLGKANILINTVQSLG